jgi:hypothetical protein
MFKSRRTSDCCTVLDVDPAPARSSHTRQWMVATAIGTALLALARWYTRPAAPAPAGTLLDQFLPAADFNGAVSVVIHAPPRPFFRRCVR